MSGQLNILYYDFFSKHTQTHYSHIGLFNIFIKSYPYEQPLGFVIGKYFYNSDELNANANFWATDGFAAWGCSRFITHTEHL
jgi:hypothetical protein